MDLAEAEALCAGFLERARAPLEGPPLRKQWKAKRPIGDEDLVALDGLMRELLALDEFDVRRLARRLDAEPAPPRHVSTKRVQWRWAVFEHLKARIIERRQHVVREGAEEEGQATPGPGRPVGGRQDV